MTPAELGKVDVLVIGAGNAAANAALSAHEAGASVAMIETAPREARGGNSAFTGGENEFPKGFCQRIVLHPHDNQFEAVRRRQRLRGSQLVDPMEVPLAPFAQVEHIDHQAVAQRGGLSAPHKMHDIEPGYH